MTRKEKLREMIIRNLKKIDKYSEEINSLSKNKEELEISTKELQEILNELVSPEVNHKLLSICDLEYEEGNKYKEVKTNIVYTIKNGELCDKHNSYVTENHALKDLIELSFVEI